MGRLPVTEGNGGRRASQLWAGPSTLGEVERFQSATTSRLSRGLRIAMGASLVNAVVYLVPNHLFIESPRLLPWTSIDAAVPFVPATVWIYFTDYFLVASAFLLCTSWTEVKRFVRAYFVLLVTGSAIHVLWPTIFPRAGLPHRGDGRHRARP